MEIVSEIFRDDCSENATRDRRISARTRRRWADRASGQAAMDKLAALTTPRYDTNEQWKHVVPVVRAARQRNNLGGRCLRGKPTRMGRRNTRGQKPSLSTRTTRRTAAWPFSPACLLQDEFCGLTLAEQRRRFFGGDSSTWPPPVGIANELRTREVCRERYRSSRLR